MFIEGSPLADYLLIGGLVLVFASFVAGAAGGTGSLLILALHFLVHMPLI